MTRPQLDAWIEAYGRAWRDRDPEQAQRLFAPAAVYRSHPFRAPHHGTEGVRAYWQQATARQRRVDSRFGDPVLAGDRAAVEWWAVLDLGDEGEVTLPGCLVLRFDDEGRCLELREYWHDQKGRSDPPDGWGH